MSNQIFTDIVSILNNCQHSIQEGALCASNYRVSDLSLLNRIEDLDICENDISAPKIGDILELRLNLYNLQKKKFYYTFEDYLKTNPYNKVSSEIKIYNDNATYIEYHNHIINLVNTIPLIAKHNYPISDRKYSVIVKDDRTLFLPLDFCIADILSLSNEKALKLADLSSLLESKTNEKAVIAINEIIMFLNNNTIPEDRRFSFLLSHIEDLDTRINASYQYYLRDFEYNRIKYELDSKAIEFRNKIQSVISDSAGKLIAIPTAFVLAGASIDFEKIISAKNIVLIISLFIFAVIINIFLGNTKYTLLRLGQTVVEYISSFNSTDIDPGKISESLSSITNDIKKQQKNICILRVILWTVPAFTFIFLVILFFA